MNELCLVNVRSTRQDGVATYRCSKLCPPNGLAKNKSKIPRIMAIGLETFKIPLSMKYGIIPCIRLSWLSVSEALSAATKIWKIVAARL